MTPAGDDSPLNADIYLQFVMLLAELSSRFINLEADDVDRDIEEALRRVCELLGIDLAVLWQWSATAPDVISPTHAYPAHDELQPLNLRKDQFPWYTSQMLAGHTVVVSSLGEFPPEAAVDRESCRQLGVKSNLTVPLRLGGEPPIGALGFNSLRQERQWTDALVTLLHLVAQVFSNALARRRHDLALRESEARVTLAAESAGAGLWTLDFLTGVFWASQRARDIFEYPPDEIITMARFEETIHPGDRDLVRGAIERAARSGAPVDVEYRIRLGVDGRERWVSSRGRPHCSLTGEPVQLTGISTDITERRRREDTHRESEARLLAATELAGLGFYDVNFRKGISYFDDRLMTICGVPPGRAAGLQPMEFWLEHLHPEDRQEVLDKREQLHDGRLDVLSIEYRFLHPAQGEKWLVHAARVARRDASGRTVKSYGVVREITTRKRAEETLKQSYGEIERLKDRLQAESDYLKAEINVANRHGEITGQSAAIRRVMRQVEQVAPADSSVIICGETGTGKELIAQVIHKLSPRHHQMMVKVNCAALPSGLVESELFGREKGAYTGALSRQVGRFEVADGSTLFLDEVGELPPDVQVKLLRVLQEGEFERLGSPRTIKVNVRVIAATNRDLTDQIRKGRFREDLYYRLNVFPIRMPPLRERPEDIPQLVWAFLEDLCSRMGKKITQVPRTTMEALQRHSWPGNVRELRNVIEHAAIITSGATLKVPALGDDVPADGLPRTLDDVEREHIVRTLEQTGWQIKGRAGAAAALGLNPATLYSRMKKLGIELKRQARDESS